MLPLADPRWQSYMGGYRVLYDASPGLRRLLADGPNEELWEEFWTELHHQSDVHQASYAAVPWLVEFVRRSSKIDWNALALVATIELERNPLWRASHWPVVSGGLLGRTSSWIATRLIGGFRKSSAGISPTPNKGDEVDRAGP
ncbi:MAG: hypothetical protein HY000_06080 [Planctomycetes bacterium]|nr:hypothetical protein [Planctomycetota bacterium]